MESQEEATAGYSRSEQAIALVCRKIVTLKLETDLSEPKLQDIITTRYSRYIKRYLSLPDRAVYDVFMLLQSFASCSSVKLNMVYASEPLHFYLCLHVLQSPVFQCGTLEHPHIRRVRLTPFRAVSQLSSHAPAPWLGLKN